MKLDSIHFVSHILQVAMEERVYNVQKYYYLLHVMFIANAKLQNVTFAIYYIMIDSALKQFLTFSI